MDRRRSIDAGCVSVSCGKNRYTGETGEWIRKAGEPHCNA